MMSGDNKERPVYGGQDAHFNFDEVLTEENVSENRELLRSKFRDQIAKDKEKIKENVYKRLEAGESD